MPQDWTALQSALESLDRVRSFLVLTLQGQVALSCGQPLTLRVSDITAVMCDSSGQCAVSTSIGTFSLVRAEPEELCGLLREFLLIVLRRGLWVFAVVLTRRLSVADEMQRVAAALAPVL